MTEPREGQVPLTCDTCGQSKPDVDECADPFTEEVYDTIVLGYWCRSCWADRKDEV